MAEEILYASITAPLGPLLVAVSARGVCRVVFGDDVAGFAAELAARMGSSVLEAPRQLSEVTFQFADYFRGRRKRFTLRLDYGLATSFQRLVFGALLQVPAGQVVSYGELARAIGRPGAGRGVGSALAHNPLPILVPCHRVIRKDGTLAGYSGGVHIKERLLTLEGVMLPIQW